MSADTDAATDATLLPLHVGDHVTDRGDTESDQRLVVMSITAATAAEVQVNDSLTVADCNESYPADDHVVEAVYAGRSDMDLTDRPRYSFPRSRLRLVQPLHDRGEDGDADE